MGNIAMSRVMPENGNRYIFPEAPKEVIPPEENRLRIRGTATVDTKLRERCYYLNEIYIINTTLIFTVEPRCI